MKIDTLELVCHS